MTCAQAQDKRGEPPVVWYAAYPGTSCGMNSVNVHDCQIEHASRLCDAEEKAEDAAAGLSPNECRRPNGWALTDIVGDAGGAPGVRKVCASPMVRGAAVSCRSWDFQLSGARLIE